MNRAGGTPIRVLVVEDSPVARELLVYLLNADQDLQVVGIAADGEQAVAAAMRLRPDVITMDIHLPKMDGFAATRKIMETCPTRIVMVTASSIPGDVAASFRALETGALTVLGKPLGPGTPGYAAAAEELVRTVKLMAEVQVVRRWNRAAAVPAPHAQPAGVRPENRHQGIRMVAIGASTGGPLVLQAILSGLQPNFKVPILIVQHISDGFEAGFVEWLNRASGYRVQIPQDGERAMPGTAYFAPNGMHMKAMANGTIALTPGMREHGMCPSVSSLFRSVAAAFGPHAAGVLLTGMGRDGAQELKSMQLAGAVTLVQDKDSAIVYGMPGEALKLDAATYVLTPEEIAATLNWLVK